jgi:hypothetical protein
MTRVGVLELLGTYEMDRGHSKRYGGTDFFEYAIGFTDSLGDTDRAVIYFGRNGRVVHVYHPTLPWARAYG